MTPREGVDQKRNDGTGKDLREGSIRSLYRIAEVGQKRRTDQGKEKEKSTQEGRVEVRADLRGVTSNRCKAPGRAHEEERTARRRRWGGGGGRGGRVKKKGVEKMWNGGHNALELETPGR